MNLRSTNPPKNLDFISQTLFLHLRSSEAECEVEEAWKRDWNCCEPGWLEASPAVGTESGDLM